ncbi:hypothetical protein PanWU01x14_331340 [Parasponia andersonii]|uniref:F-box associated domain-containing protein n=1 Tax=Parasponia andersonii TaxID=3476 RepID=A0A2P5AHN6_PARAD|nr:hypothetical protein PanWU01x14_331340 [Parasponia andersonii]
MSRHLLRSMIDREESLIKDQAHAIDPPNFKVAKHSPNTKGYCCLGLSNDHINFMAFDKELNLCIWVLTDTCEYWSLRSRLSNNFCGPLAFHPYLDVVFIGINSLRLGSLI